MTKQEEAAHNLEQAAEEVRRFINECPDDAWGRVTEGDGRTVSQIAHHCAMGNNLAMGWVSYMLVSRPILETSDMHDALNHEEAERSPAITKDEVIEELRRSTSRFAAFLRSLADVELHSSSMHGVLGRERSVGQFIGVSGRHMLGHLETMKSAVAT